MQDADLDGVLGLGGRHGRQKAERKPGGQKPAAGDRSLGDRTDGMDHRDVPLVRRTRLSPGRGPRTSAIASHVPMLKSGVSI